MALVTVAALAALAALAACGSKKSDGTAGGSAAGGSAGSAGSGEGSAGPAGAGPGEAAYCIPSDAANELAAFTADDTTATFCIGKEGVEKAGEKAAPKCAVVDLATGAYRTAEAAPRAPTPHAPALIIKQDDGLALACKGTACQKLELPKPKGEDDAAEYHVAVSSDGKHAAATGGGLDGVAFLDATTGKQRKLVKLAAAGTCVDGAHFVGDAVYVATSNCDGPGGKGALYSSDGKKLGDLGPATFNPYDAEPVDVGGDHWALVGYGGGSVLVFDGKTGAQVHMVELPPPAGCAQCGAALGNPAQWSAAPIAKQPAGKLAIVGGAGVSIVDPGTGKLEKSHPLPICPAAK
ncbi:MAG TPA: hypothetical protein VNO30_29405 [Kofleriaceae bacterium]|nr:hypothetical protein [Kofleriaceae bacterium]